MGREAGGPRYVFRLSPGGVYSYEYGVSSSPLLGQAETTAIE